MGENDIEELLTEALYAYDEENNDGEDISSIRSFNDTGLLTSNSGIVVRMNDGSEFQITIVQSK
jgi:hypothetical protein